MSLEWARSVASEEFELEVDEASLEALAALSGELREEQGRLERLYVEFPRGSEQRRFIKRQIREMAAHSGSVGVSIFSHPERVSHVHAKEEAGESGRDGG